MDTSHRAPRQPSFNARALDLASEIGDNKFNAIGGGGGHGGGDDFGGIPASFSEAFLRERTFERRRQEEKKRNEEEEKGMVNRIMLARMNTLEEGFREVLKEIKQISTSAAVSRRGSEGETVPFPGPRSRVKGERLDGRRSPRKVTRKKGKEAEKERPGSGLKEEEAADDDDTHSPVSVVTASHSKGGSVDADPGEERPVTAVGSSEEVKDE